MRKINLTFHQSYYLESKTLNNNNQTFTKLGVFQKNLIEQEVLNYS
jgi:hypothetical protein